MPFEIQTDVGEYRLAIPDGDVGPEVEYGCHATLDVGGVLHFTLIGLDSIDADTADVFAVRMDGPPDMVFTAPTVDTEFIDDEDEDEEMEPEDLQTDNTGAMVTKGYAPARWSKRDLRPARG